MKKIFLSLCLIFLHCYCMAEDFAHFSIAEGLPCSFVVDVCVDGQDRVWIATDNGLYVYDGTGFVCFSAHNSALSGDALNHLYYDTKTGIVWVATKVKVSAIDSQTMQFINLPDIDYSGIQYITQASDGGVWAGARGDGLMHYDAEGKKVVTKTANQMGVPNSFISVYDDNGRLYLGTVFDGMSIYDPKNGKVQRFVHKENDPSSLPGNQVYEFCRDHYGRLWIGTDHGLALMNEDNGTFINFHHDGNRSEESLIGDHIYALSEHGDGQLWVCTDIGGISCLPLQNVDFAHPEQTRFHNFVATYDATGLSSANIRQAYSDHFGNVWIANYGSGISCLMHQPSRFTTLDTDPQKGVQIHKSVRGIYADKLTNQLWVGAENEVMVFNESHHLISRYDLSPYLIRPNGNVYCILRNGSGMFVGLKDNGLLRIDLNTKRISRVEIGRDVDVNALWNDDDGSLWIGTQTGVVHYAEGKAEARTIKGTGGVVPSIFGFLRDGQHQLWINTFGMGIYLCDDSLNRDICLNVSNGKLPSDIVPYMMKDSQGNIWSATFGGLVEYPQEDWHKSRFFAHDSGLNDIMVHAVAEDASHNIWFSTDRGLSCLNPSSGNVENYSYEDGIPYGNFQHGSVAASNDGELYFGTHDGLCLFNPTQVLNPVECSPVHIYRVDRGEGKDKSITFTFCVSDQAQRKSAAYEYRILGLSETWTELGSQTFITFRDLRAGHYTFQVRAKLRNMLLDEQNIASSEFRILPPWWLSWWAFLGYAILFSLLISWIFASYRRRLLLKSSLEVARRNNINEQHLNRERIKFFTNITHELRTPLTLIIGPLDDIRQDSQLPERLRQKVNVIHSNATQLLGLVNEILEFRKTETENHQLIVERMDLAPLVKEIGLRFKELNRNPKLNFIIAVPSSSQTLLADRNALSTILNNLLSNALKYTPEGKVRLSLRYEGEQAILEVADTGYGIRAKDLPHIFDRYFQTDSEHQQAGTGIGLAVVKALATLHKADLSVNSKEEQGTTFSLVLNIAETYPEAMHREPIETSATESNALAQSYSVSNVESSNVKPIILVVEDNEDIRHYIADSFAEKYEVIQAANGKEGCELALQQIPDLIISDIMMPVMDGIALCHQIKQDMRTSHIPVILLTAKDTVEDKTIGYETGADAYLTKPFSSRMLLACVTNQFEQRRRLTAFLSAQSGSTQVLSSSIQKEKTTSSPALSKLDKEFLDKVDQFISNNLSDNDLAIGDLCTSLAFSHSTLYRKIKSLTGLSANEYIRRERLRHAMKMLRAGGQNVSAIAYSCGFSDMGYFITCFKKEFGATPSTFLVK